MNNRFTKEKEIPHRPQYLGVFPFSSIRFSGKDLGPEAQLSNLTIIFKVYFRNLELLGLQIFNIEGRNLEFPVKKLELAHTLYIGVFANNSLAKEMGFLLRCMLEV